MGHKWPWTQTSSYRFFHCRKLWKVKAANNWLHRLKIHISRHVLASISEIVSLPRKCGELHACRKWNNLSCDIASKKTVSTIRPPSSRTFGIYRKWITWLRASYWYAKLRLERNTRSLRLFGLCERNDGIYNGKCQYIWLLRAFPYNFLRIR